MAIDDLLEQIDEACQEEHPELLACVWRIVTDKDGNRQVKHWWHAADFPVGDMEAALDNLDQSLGEVWPEGFDLGGKLPEPPDEQLGGGLG